MPQTIKLDALTLRVSSELMKNHVAGTMVEVRPDLRVAYDTRGEPILFWIDQAPFFLCAAVRSPTSRTGWRRCALTGTTQGTIKAFDVHQLPDGSLNVVCVAEHWDGTNLGPRTLWAAGGWSNDAAGSHWDGIASQWTACGEISASWYRDEVRFGAGPMAVVAASGSRHFHLVRREGERWTSNDFDMPSGVEMPRHLEAATVGGARGVFVLRGDASAQVLEFTPLLDPGERRTFQLPEHARSITAVVPPKGGEPDVYVGSTGVHVFPGARADAPATVIAPGSALEIHRLHVVQDAGCTSMFAVADLAFRVLHTERVGAEPWSPPLQIWTGASSLAAMRSAGANALFTQLSAGPIHYFQDARSKLWKAMSILVPSSRTEEFMSYTTRIEIRDDANRPAIAQELQLRASSRTYVYANGQLQLADPEHPALVETDLTGALTLALLVDDLAAPTLFVRTPGGTEAELRPSRDLEAKLSRPENLSSERLAAVGAAPVDDKTIGVMREAVGTLLMEAARLEERARADHAGLLRAPATAPTYALSFVDGEARLTVHHTNRLLHADAGASAADASVAAGVPPEWLPDWAKALYVEAGNALAWIYERIADVKNFVWWVAGEALEFLIKVGADWIRFVVTTIEAGLRAIDFLLEKVLGLDLSRVWQWLGFVFDWDEIHRLRDMLVKQVVDGCARIESEIPTLAKRTDDMLAELRKHLPSTSPSLVPKSFEELVASAHEATEEHPKLGEAHGSPATNWAITQLLHGGMLDMSIDGIAPSVDGEAIAKQLVTAWEATGAARETLARDFFALFEQGVDFGEAMKLLLSDATFTLVEKLRDFVVKAFEHLRTSIAELLKLLTTPMPIPLVRGLLGRDVSILEAVALVIAVPTSVANRIVTGRPLFADAKPRMLLLAAAPEPDYVWDKVFTWATVAYDGLNVAAAGISVLVPLLGKKEVPLGVLLAVDLARFAANMLRLFPNYPAGETAQTPYQRGAWWAYTLFLLGETGVWLWLALSRKLRLTKEDIEIINQARGFCIVLAAVAAFVFEALTTEIDFKSTDQEFLKDARLKLAQNIFYLIADGISGGLSLVPAKYKDKNPKTARAAMIALGVSGAAGSIAALFNGIRVWKNEELKRHHQPF